MAGELARKMAEEKDRIVTACIRNVVGPEVRIKDVLVAGRVKCLVGKDDKSEIYTLDGEPLAEIWPPEVKTEDGRMTVSISYRVLNKPAAAADQAKKEGL